MPKEKLSSFLIIPNQHEPEMTKEVIKKLKDAGWKESKNVFGDCLICPKEQRDKIIPALAHALINWRITSNQARTLPGFNDRRCRQ